MFYHNKKLNIICLSAQRTGSQIICKLLSESLKITPKLRNNDDNKRPMEAGEILHSHMYNDVTLGNNDTLYILNTRNMVESTYSRLIALYTNKYNYFNFNKNEITPFICDLKDFKKIYGDCLHFYTNLKPILPTNTIRIDYSEFQYDIKNILRILKIPVVFYKANKVPNIKTPGTYRDWIINFDEIDAYAQTISPNPPI
jgi:hypothetical protein